MSIKIEPGQKRKMKAFSLSPEVIKFIDKKSYEEDISASRLVDTFIRMIAHLAPFEKQEEGVNLFRTTNEE